MNEFLRLLAKHAFETGGKMKLDNINTIFHVDPHHTAYDWLQQLLERTCHF